MKKIFFLFFGGVMTLSQSYADDAPVRPFAVEGKVWFLRTGMTYIAQGDTIIDSKTYKRMFQYQAGEELMYIGGVRDEGTRVYWVAAGTETKKCLYDFLPQNGIFSYNGSDYYVSTDDYGRADGVFTCEVGKMEGDAIGGWSHWITGVGDLDGPILTDYASTGEQRLLYCRVGNEYLYKDYQYIEPTILEDSKTWKVLDYAGNAPLEYNKLYAFSIVGDSIAEGRTWKKLAIKTDGNKAIRLVREEAQRIYLFDEENRNSTLLCDFSQTTGDELTVCSGLVVNHDLAPNQAINVKICEDETVFNSGYPYRAITMECEETGFVGETGAAKTTWLERIGNTSFPFANPLINPDENSGHTWLVVECSVNDEVIYSDVPANIAAVPNWEEVLSGITATTTSNNSSSVVFDLQGRRLAAPPARGIYIHGGRKYAK